LAGLFFSVVPYASKDGFQIPKALKTFDLQISGKLKLDHYQKSKLQEELQKANEYLEWRVEGRTAGIYEVDFDTQRWVTVNDVNSL
jgi:hypothetical protein